MRSELDAVAFGTAFAIGAIGLSAVVSAWCRGKKQTRPNPPNSRAEWKLVGTLANITIYPMKSAKGIDLSQAELTQLGLQQVNSASDKLQLRDRYLMVFREDNGEMVTARTYPVILLCSVASESNNTIRLSYPGKSDVILQIPSQGKKITKMWKDEMVECLDCGDEVAKWITEVVNNNRDKDSIIKMRLGYWPSSTATRNIIGAWKELEDLFKGTTNIDGGAFSDFTSYMLMTSSSMNELNRRVTTDIQISHRQFRPNFYIDSDQPPFSELKWKWVKIGSNVFRVVKGCQRCTLTTFDATTSKKLPNNEPLRTLNSIEDAKCKEPIEESPMMGIHLGFYKPGTVQLGDPVYILK